MTDKPDTTNAPAREIVRTASANEWGQISGLEANAPYFVIRKPTPDFTREKTKDLLTEARAFLHEHRVLTDQQMRELNEKYGEPARARVQEVRSTLERRFDEIAREIETRVEKLEGELQERGFLAGGRKPPAGQGETPGEMPR